MARIHTRPDGRPLNPDTRRPCSEDDRQRSENGIDDKKISCASQETPEKTSYGPKNAGAKDEQVHEHDVWRDDPYKDDGLFAAIALYGHCAKVAYPALSYSPESTSCLKYG